MPVDLNTGINVRIQGEIGKHNTLPIEYLVKFSENLQKLLQDIANYQLEVDGAIDLSNFKIELSGFKIGSAIPEFIFTPRIKPVTSGDVFEQRVFVNNQFDKYLNIANHGDYSNFKNIIPQAKTRNIIVEDFYNFATTFGNSPVSIVDIKNGNISPVYKINKFKSNIKDLLITKIIESDVKVEEYEAVAKIKVVKKGNKTTHTKTDMFDAKHAHPGFSIGTVTYNNLTYNLAFPLMCKLEKEEDYFIVQSDILDIVGTGYTINDAEKNFAEEFHFIYTRYNQVSNKMLSDRLQRIKNIINSLVLKIED